MTDLSPFRWRTTGVPVVVLVALTVLSQPFGVSFELFTLIMAILGIKYLIGHWSELNQSPALKAYTALFACFWVPALISLVDVNAFQKGLIGTVGLLRFYFAGVFVIGHTSTLQLQKVLGLVITAIVLFWLVDAGVQFFLGYDLFGIASYSPGRISGIFGDDPVLGWMLVLYLGTVTVTIHQYFGRLWAGIVLLALVATIFMSGNRGAWLALIWIGLFISILSVLWKIRLSKRLLLGCVIVIFAAVAGLSQHQGVQARVAYTFDAVGKDYAAWDRSTSYRLTLWDTAFNMLSDHWINGVGVKNFRYAYPEYAQENDLFVRKDPKTGEVTGAFHAHQIVFEALAETGLVGLAGLLMAFWLVFWRFFWQVVNLRQWVPLGYYCGLVGALFPLNTHLSLFAGYWAQAFWLLAALFLAALSAFKEDKLV